MRITKDFYISGHKDKIVKNDCELYYSKEERGYSAVCYTSKRQHKPVFNYLFKDYERMIKEFEDVIENKKQREKVLAEYKEKRKANDLELGDILYSTWGYEQTNVDFYQVIAKTNRTVTIRKIKATTHENTGWCIRTVLPCKDEFVEDEPKMRKVVNNNYVSIASYATASKWNGKPVEETSYH